MQNYNYVIARFWRDEHKGINNDSLCVYTYGSATHYGTLEQAKDFAANITEWADDGYVYKPFVIDPTPIEDYDFNKPIECLDVCECPEACKNNGFCYKKINKKK